MWFLESLKVKEHNLIDWPAAKDVAVLVSKGAWEAEEPIFFPVCGTVSWVLSLTWPKEANLGKKARTAKC